MSDKTDNLKKAREAKARQKAQAVQKAIEQLTEHHEVITYSAVAKLANVSRPYLYQHHKEKIEALRKDTREQEEKVDGKTVPNRTHDEYKHIEALLRNKIERLKTDLKKARRELATTKQMLEKQRGQTEHWRGQCVKS